MSALQKRCFFFSAGMHGLLLAVLVASAAFSSKPPVNNTMMRITMIPSRVLDEPGAGGGGAAAGAAPAPQPIPTPIVPQPQPVATPAPKAEPKPVEPVQPVEPVRPRHREPEPDHTPSSVPTHEAKLKPVHQTHEIQPDFTPATATPRHTRTHTATAENSAQSLPAHSRSQLRRDLARSLGDLAEGIKTSGAQGVVTDMPGQGGGESFIGYETLIYNAYFHAWLTPDSVTDKLAAADVKLVVARDGSIISAEIVHGSGDKTLDRSVERALRAVTSLPPFPASAHDERRSFVLRFNLQAKEGSG